MKRVGLVNEGKRGTQISILSINHQTGDNWRFSDNVCRANFLPLKGSLTKELALVESTNELFGNIGVHILGTENSLPMINRHIDRAITDDKKGVALLSLSNYVAATFKSELSVGKETRYYC